MSRLLPAGLLLALAACAATPEAPAAPEAPQTARGGPAWVPPRASDAPGLLPFPPGFGRRREAPGDERPAWLPRLPADIPRYRAPEVWPRDTLAALDGAAFGLAPR